MFLCSHSSIADDGHDLKEGTQDGQQKSIKDEQTHPQTSQLVQEEKVQTGNVSHYITG